MAKKQPSRFNKGTHYCSHRILLCNSDTLDKRHAHASNASEDILRTLSTRVPVNKHESNGTNLDANSVSISLRMLPTFLYRAKLPLPVGSVY